MKDRPPALFFGHGNPMFAITDNRYADAWSAVGRTLPRPRAVLCISAHWYEPTRAVTATATPTTIHDFGGFPAELYRVEYPAPGDPFLAERVVGLLRTDGFVLDEVRGLDHGTWSVLLHVFPDADVPVVQLSIDLTRPGRWHDALARKLRALRDEGVMIVGSGNLVHNLHSYAWGRSDVDAFDWALRFEESVRDRLSRADFLSLVEYEHLGPDARLAVPTPDHYLPLLYVLAQVRDDDDITFPVEGFDGGSMSMLSVRIG